MNIAGFIISLERESTEYFSPNAAWGMRYPSGRHIPVFPLSFYYGRTCRRPGTVLKSANILQIKRGETLSEEEKNPIIILLSLKLLFIEYILKEIMCVKLKFCKNTSVYQLRANK